MTSTLYFGGSSNIAQELAKNFKNIDAVSSRKVSNVYRKLFIIKKYNSLGFKKLEKKINVKYDNILIFNGFYTSSFLSMFNRKNFINDFEINYLIPMEIASFAIKKKILKKNGAIYFISSIAASEHQIGNANYSISKNALNFSSKILGNEQKKRDIRVNTISFGLIKNEMGLKVKKMTNTNKKFLSLKKIVKRIKLVLSDKKTNKRNFKFYND